MVTIKMESKSVGLVEAGRGRGWGGGVGWSWVQTHGWDYCSPGPQVLSD